MRRAFAVMLALSLLPAATADAQKKRSKPKRPDLVISFAGSPPASAGPGTSFASSVVVRNRGKATAGGSKTRFFLSLDRAVGRGDMRLGDVTVPRLRVTRQTTRRGQLKIPSFAHQGTYWLIACANRPLQLKESSQKNNCRVARRQVRIARGSVGPTPPPSSIPGGLSISPGSQAFGSAGVGARSAAVVFTVTNTGATSTGTLGTSMVGSAAAQFIPTADTCAGTVLGGGGTCSITVVFGPTSTGDKSANLQVSGSPGGTVGSQLTGTGITPAQLAISASQHQFGTVDTSAPSEPVVFTITNTGQATSGALTNALSGTHSAQYTISASSCASATLAGGATCTVSVRFAPTSVGAKTATLDVSATPGGSVAATLNGTGTQIRITPASHNFPNTATSTISPTQTFVVRNVGSTDANLLPVSVTGEFGKPTDTCGATLGPNATCNVTLDFRPTTTGAKTGTMQVTSALHGSNSAALSGTGIRPAQLEIQPASQPFGEAPVNSAPNAVVIGFTVRNVGEATSGTLVAPSITGDTTSFSVVSGSTCTGTLAGGATCSVSVRFAPTTAGAKTGQLNVSASPGGAAAATLTGTGVNVTITPTSRNYGSVPVNALSGALQFTVTNHGPTSGAVTTSLGGTNPTEFAIVPLAMNDCNGLMSLATGASCSVSVQFKPTGTPGARSATLIVNGGASHTVQAALSGTATA